MESRNGIKWWAVWLLCLALCLVVSGHSHSHGPEGERPSFKYSKEANEPSTVHSHSHSHGHSHKAHGHQHSHIADPHRDDLDRSSKKSSKLSSNNSVWLNALLSTILISMAPFLVLFLIPVDNKIEHKPLLKILLSFASGGLLGDAFLHLIPHAVTAVGGDHSHSHSHSHSHQEEPHEHDLSVGLSVLAGFVAFLIVEKFILIVKGSHGHQHSHQHDSHTPSPKTPPLIAKEIKSDPVEETAAAGDTPRKHHRSGDDNLQAAAGDTPRKQATEENETENTSPVATSAVPETEFSSIKTAGYLNLAADFFHNFTDGLAIGASFLAGQTIGIITTMTVLLHEVPHEIGDFAILIQSGCSRRKAMLLQLVTAVGALTGCLVSLAAEGLGDVTAVWTLPFTAGGFIYIATVSVIPELLEETNAFQSIKELFAMFVGIYMMVLIAKYE